MKRDKSDRSPSLRGEPVRQRVLDAAERLLRDGRAEFSMRDLAAEAGVSFATPFNQFGSKAAIMQALSERRIVTMTELFAAAPYLADVTARVALAVEVAIAVMLEEPTVNRAVMGWIGSADPVPGNALERSQRLWALALGPDHEEAGRSAHNLPQHLALAFRGALSFWSAGEMSDEQFRTAALGAAKALLSA